MSLKKKYIASFVVFAMLMFLGTLVPQSLENFFVSGTKVAAQSQSKQATLDQMRTLQQSINSLKQQASKDASVKPQLESLIDQYNALKASLGGDEPVAVGPSPKVGTIPRNEAAPACDGVVTTNFPNNTPVTIPTGPAVVTSTITVSGAAPYLFDVDLTTFITHTFNGDLDITLTSPSGTVVTITTDNGGGSDNVFNGTLFDDDANPMGQVPYTINNGVTTDHSYVNLVTATPLTPEEPLAAFIGENPNGVWTLTISDDAAGDGGALNSWNLDISTLPATPTPTTTSFTNNTPTNILDVNTVTSTINVTGAGTTVGKLTLQPFITHTFPGDLDITLTSPSGTVVTVTTDNAGTSDNVFNGTLFDDDANPMGQVPYLNNSTVTSGPGIVTDQLYALNVVVNNLTPEEPFGAFIGEDPNGTWTLTISDDLGGDIGVLNSWMLNITTIDINCGGATLEHLTVYAADTLNNRIQRTLDDGMSWQAVGFGPGVGLGQFNAPQGVSSDSTDMLIFVADTNNNRVQRSTDGGMSWQVIAGPGTAVGTVNAPQGVAYDEQNDVLYVADTLNNRIQMATSASTTPLFGVYAGATVGTALGKVNRPAAVAIDINGGVYVADTNNNRIQFNTTGAPTGWAIFAGATAGTALGKVNSPRGIYVDTAGNVYIADTLNNRIQMNVGGTAMGWMTFMAPGTTLGTVNAPQGVVLAASGNVFIGDTKNNRMQKKPLMGGPATLVGAPGTGIGNFNGPTGVR
ncbi:MAG: proprotein convertase P-domain-containing protein [Blastocatellia bacterium]|nr:proprotein convertase P-domain-containing protein [Blastocatellia bacterium]